MRLLGAAAAMLMLAACSTAPLPTATLNGTAGKAVSSCWEAKCVDGFPGANAPLVRAPASITLDQQPTELQVFVRRGSGPSFEQREVTVNGGKLGPIPAGDWDYLLAMTRFSDGSAMYAWRLR